jgi:flagellin
LASVEVNSARIADGATRTVTVAVTTSAETGYLRFAASGLAAGNSVTLEVQGNLGTENFSFAASASTTTILTAINAAKDLTGVSATTSTNNSGLIFSSTEFGSDQFVSIKALQGTFTVADRNSNTTTKDFGGDVVATISGQSVTGTGRDVSLNSASLGVDVTLSTSFSQDTNNTSTFGVTGGGATFALSPELNLVGRQSIGIASVTTGNLGKSGIGFISSLGSGQANDLKQKNFLAAQNIIRAAGTKVASLRGRLGSFQKDTLESTIRSLQVTLENTTAAESAIRDTDFATETSKLTRSQILVAAGTSTLQLSNAAPQSVLSLLG